jgi:hypothetical protein
LSIVTIGFLPRTACSQLVLDELGVLKFGKPPLTVVAAITYDIHVSKQPRGTWPFGQ